MKKFAINAAAAVISVFISLTSAFTSESIAADHYRIGTLNESRHYRDNEDFNSSHNGIYLVHNNNVIGTYFNSDYKQSFFYARNSPINKTFSYTYGVAIGYNSGMVPMVGLSAQLGVFKLTFTQEAAVIGLEFSLL